MKTFLQLSKYYDVELDRNSVVKTKRYKDVFLYCPGSLLELLGKITKSSVKISILRPKFAPHTTSIRIKQRKDKFSFSPYSSTDVPIYPSSETPSNGLTPHGCFADCYCHTRKAMRAVSRERDGPLMRCTTSCSSCCVLHPGPD